MLKLDITMSKVSSMFGWTNEQWGMHVLCLGSLPSGMML